MTMTMAGGVGGGPGTWNIYIFVECLYIPQEYTIVVAKVVSNCDSKRPVRLCAYVTTDGCRESGSSDGSK